MDRIVCCARRDDKDKSDSPARRSDSIHADNFDWNIKRKNILCGFLSFSFDSRSVHPTILRRMYGYTVWSELLARAYVFKKFCRFCVHAWDCFDFKGSDDLSAVRCTCKIHTNKRIRVHNLIVEFLDWLKWVVGFFLSLVCGFGQQVAEALYIQKLGGNGQMRRIKNFSTII